MGTGYRGRGMFKGKEVGDITERQIDRHGGTHTGLWRAVERR
jgi:hypothetical protein